MTASILYIVAQLSHAMIAFYNPSYKLERSHIFLSYQVINAIVSIYNVFYLNKAPWTHKIGCKLGIKSKTDFDAESRTSHYIARLLCDHCLAVTRPKQSNYYVWREFINHTGWESKGLVFLLGLIKPAWFWTLGWRRPSGRR